MNYLSNRILRWWGINRFSKVTKFLLFSFLFILPIADELIGSWQFKRLCESEAVVTLSSEWKSVKRARSASDGPIQLRGYAIQIREWRTIFIDQDTGKEFFLSRGFITNGGFMFDRIGLSFGKSTSCSPPDEDRILEMIDIDQLLNKGKIE